MSLLTPSRSMGHTGSRTSIELACLGGKGKSGDAEPWTSTLNLGAQSRGFQGGAAGCLRTVTVAVLLVATAACSERPNVFTESRSSRLDRLSEEQARLERTRDPVDRTRIQVRISDLLVSFVGDAVAAGDLEAVEARVSEYRSTVTEARDTMINSGRDASRQVGGFRDLEIALRQHMRQLDDIGARLPVDNREPIETLIADVAEIREELLGALFPVQNES